MARVTDQERVMRYFEEADPKACETMLGVIKRIMKKRPECQKEKSQASIPAAIPVSSAQSEASSEALTL